MSEGRGLQYKNVCFTLFERPNIDLEKVQYYVYQMETSPSTGRIHWQGYLELKEGTKMRLKTLKDKVFRSNTVHIEARRGTQQEAIDYCKKEETRAPALLAHELPAELIAAEYGTPKENRSGERTDLQKMIDEARSGVSLSALRESQSEIVAKYGKFCADFCADVARASIPAWRQLDVTVLWGHTGMGKTRRVYHDHPYPELFKLDPCGIDKLWWDGYEGQDVLLIDDYYGWISIGNLLNILDGYPLRLSVKGSFTYAAWTKVYITSNEGPDNWYKAPNALTPGQTNALSRRLNIVTHVTTEWKPDEPDSQRRRVEVPIYGPPPMPAVIQTMDIESMVQYDLAGQIRAIELIE